VSNPNLPILRPSKIICAGLNYRPHADEAQMEVPKQPLLFAKFPSSLIGPDEPIVLPSFATQVDYEAELAVVIGTSARSIGVDDALDVVAGYTCLNDVSARDIQFADGQWTRGKSFDTFCPIGPALVPAAAVGDPQGLRVRCYLNGELVQDDSTVNMIFSVAELISHASQCTQLEPGDVIATGTPAGVALGQENPRWLRDGDVVTVEIEGIGVLRNPVRTDASESGRGVRVVR
jgi:5-carboxymethyl-2-hydroxymuconate isomerase